MRVNVCRLNGISAFLFCYIDWVDKFFDCFSSEESFLAFDAIDKFMTHFSFYRLIEVEVPLIDNRIYKHITFERLNEVVFI